MCVVPLSRMYSGYITATGMVPIMLKLCYAALLKKCDNYVVDYVQKGVELAHERLLLMILEDVGMTVPKRNSTHLT